MGEVGIFMADHLPPCVIGMEGLIGVPRIVHHLGAAMVVGTHREQMFLRQVHHPLALVLIIGSTIGVWAVVEVGEVTVQVDMVAILTRGAINGVVAPMVGAVGVGAREDEKVDIVQDVEDTGVVAGAELVDETQHQDHARHLVAVHGGGIEEMGLAVGLAVVEARAHQLTATGQRA